MKRCNFQLSHHTPVHPFPFCPDRFQKFPVITDCKLCRSRRRRCTKIRHIIYDRRVCLMSYCRNNRYTTFKNCARYIFLVKRPQIFNRASASANDHHIDLCFLQCTDPPHHTFRRAIPLYQCRIQKNLHIWISPPGDVDNIAHCRSGWCRYNTDCPHIFRNRLFIFRRKHSHFFQLFFELYKFFIEKSRTIQYDLLGINLVSAISFIDADASKHDHLLSFLHTKRKPAALPGKHNTGNRSGLIFQ